MVACLVARPLDVTEGGEGRDDVEPAVRGAADPGSHRDHVLGGVQREDHLVEDAEEQGLVRRGRQVDVPLADGGPA